MYHQEPRARAHGRGLYPWCGRERGGRNWVVSSLGSSFSFSDLLMQASSRARRDYCFRLGERERESGGEEDRTRGKSNLPSEGSFVRAREVQRMIRGELERRPQ